MSEPGVVVPPIGSLHIPYPEWASDPRAYDHLFIDLLVIQRWADAQTCTGTNQPHFENGQTRRAFHWPYLEAVVSDADGGYLEANYLAFERWANTLCHGLHIPYKQWLREDPLSPAGPERERANLLAIARWSLTIGACCVDEGGVG